jgi:hypothetical protein
MGSQSAQPSRPRVREATDADRPTPQRRGSRLSDLYPGAVDESRRRLKPEIPEIGEYGIPIRDEIVLERRYPSGDPDL